MNVLIETVVVLGVVWVCYKLVKPRLDKKIHEMETELQKRKLEK